MSLIIAMFDADNHTATTRGNREKKALSGSMYDFLTLAGVITEQRSFQHDIHAVKDCYETRFA